MPSANTEYSYAFPPYVKRIMFGLRGVVTGDYCYYSWQPGQVAGPSGDYSTLNPGTSRDLEGCQFDNGQTLYFASNGDGEALEIEWWY